MRALLRYLLGHDFKWWGWLILFGLCLAATLNAFYVNGSFTTTGIDERQNSEFGEALDSQPPPVPIAAALEAGGPEFAAQMREALKKASNGVRQARGLDLSFEKSRPAEPAQADWSDTYICGLHPSWGDHRDVVRTLVLKGYAECGAGAKRVAKSPILYRDNGWLGTLLVWLATLLPVLLIFGVFALHHVRRAYHWLYSSSVV